MKPRDRLNCIFNKGDDLMKRFWIVVGSVCIFVLLVVLLLYCIDMNRIKNNEKVLFSTWGLRYIPPIRDNKTSAIKEKIFVIKNNEINNENVIDEFIRNTNVYAQNRCSDRIRIVQYTIEGDRIITDLKYEEEVYEIIVDNTEDKFASSENRKVIANTYDGKIYDIKKIEDNERYIIKLVPKDFVEFIEIPPDIIICSYEKDLEDKQLEDKEYFSFIGTILEETTTYMVVKPNEDEEEAKTSDKIIIHYGTDHIDYLYGIGRKVLIQYTGYIMETYPAKIYTDNIKPDGYSDFTLSMQKSEEKSKKKILNNQELYQNNANYNLYYYGLEQVNITINNKTMPLEQALREGKLTIDGIISKANRDDNKQIIQSNGYYDGGTIEYYYPNYTIIKRHSLDGNRDVYIGISEMRLKDIS